MRGLERLVAWAGEIFGGNFSGSRENVKLRETAISE